MFGFWAVVSTVWGGYFCGSAAVEAIKAGAPGRAVGYIVFVAVMAVLSGYLASRADAVRAEKHRRSDREFRTDIMLLLGSAPDYSVRSVELRKTLSAMYRRDVIIGYLWARIDELLEDGFVKYETRHQCKPSRGWVTLTGKGIKALAPGGEFGPKEIHAPTQ